MERALSARLLGKKASRQILDCLQMRLPPLVPPPSRAVWLRRAAGVRRRVLELFFRGHAAGVLDESPQVVWGGTLEHDEYRIRKLRYEGYPGLWVPALLYEPRKLHGKAPVVLNPNGHHAGGKAMDYKQARCINLAKRGMLALNPEFIGMGQLRADVDHNRIGHLDLCGVAGIGVFYLLIKRGLDVLLDQPQADAGRVAMTGLSGGGWQTALLAALDERITAIAPVAGHSPMWQRRGCIEDIGDLEQCPSDLGTVADYDLLTALFAPRPTLLIYNRNDDCCFQTRRTRQSIFKPVKPYFALLGAADQVGLYDNVDPGTHNYEADNRAQLYGFLNRCFGLETPAEDLPWRDELHTEAELNTGLPAANATLLSLAQQALVEIRKRREGKRKKPSRTRLRQVLCVATWDEVAVESRKATVHKGRTVRQHIVQLGGQVGGQWSVPVTEISPDGVQEVELFIGDSGRRYAVADGTRRVLAADIFGSGESHCSWQYHMLLAASGARSLGVQVGQVLALVEWARQYYKVERVHLRLAGTVLSVAGLAAAALAPGQIASIRTAALMDSLDRLIDWPLKYAEAAPLFCFGLLAEFDLPELIALSAPVPIIDGQRGPLRL